MATITRREARAVLDALDALAGQLFRLRSRWDAADQKKFSRAARILERVLQQNEQNVPS